MPRYAAVDIGSNSIRMEAAEVVPGQPPAILASDRQVVRLGESVFRNGALSAEAIDLALSVLTRLAAQYRGLGVVGVRAVATSALRDARNQAEFVSRASQALGIEVEVISGREEARLIHLGVQSRWPNPGKRVLIIDIGGGSAEIILSENGHIREAVTRPLGAVRLREMFLPQDPPAPQDLVRLRELIDEKLAGLSQRMGGPRPDRFIATSATASAAVSAIAHVAREKRDLADRLRAPVPQIRSLLKKLSTLNAAQRRKVTGIGPRRAEIIVPGVAVLLRILEMFSAPAVYYSAAGVRDGIIADLAARGVGSELSQMDRDQRKEVEAMSARYGVSLKHARKVAGLARALFAALQPLHELPPHYGRLLEAASYLHDIGHFVNDVSHHKHSFYLVTNSDLSGFTNAERMLIANLCRYHRKAAPSPAHANFQQLTPEQRRALGCLYPLLRLADSLDRSHDQRIEAMHCFLRDGQVVLEIVSPEAVDLEEWAAQRNGELFRQAYNRPLVVRHARAPVA